MSIETNMVNAKVTKMHLSTQQTRSGRIKSHIAEVYEIKTNFFNSPLIVMSDLHEGAMTGVKKLAKMVNLEDYIVITAGDMSGTGIRGEDGYPYEVYEYLHEHANLFYFVQGNHDLPDRAKREKYLKNDDGSYCMIRDYEILNTPLGTIAGINGIISRRPHPYKSPPEIFLKKTEELLAKNPKIFISHETPKIRVNQVALNGDKDFYQLVIKYKPQIHIYGHCHHFFNMKRVNGVLFMNVDSRINIFNPE